MTNEPTTTSPVAAKEIDEAAAKYVISLFKEGKDTSFIVSNMVENGYGYEQSYALVTIIEQKIAEAQVTREKKNGPLNLILGIVILTGGILVTTSGVGVIAYGAIIVGALKVIQGLANL